MSEGEQQNGQGGKGAAPKRAYAISLSGKPNGVPAVGAWEAENAKTAVFCEAVTLTDLDEAAQDDPLEVRAAKQVDAEDLMHLATVDAVDRDAAVGILLKGEDPRVQNERCEVVRAAYGAHVNVDFVTPADSALGVVERHWQMTYVPVNG